MSTNTPLTPSLATDVEGIVERVSRLHAPGSRELAAAYIADPSDVFIATYPKCGTTLMQQIVHGLRTGGSMDFQEISAVVPWFEASLDLDQRPQDPQPARPHAFKSHLKFECLPEGAKYIHVTRDPRDVVLSFFNFFSGWIFDPDHVDLDAFVREFLLEGSGSGRYWDHVESWWPTIGRDDVLMFAFEDLTADPRLAVERVSDFIGIDKSEELIDTVTRQAGIDFMRAHGGQFDDHLFRERRNVAAGVPPTASTTKVRSGKVGDHKRSLSPSLAAVLANEWERVVYPATGLADYEAYRAAIAAQALA